MSHEVLEDSDLGNLQMIRSLFWDQVSRNYWGVRDPSSDNNGSLIKLKPFCTSSRTVEVSWVNTSSEMTIKPGQWAFSNEFGYCQAIIKYGVSSNIVLRHNLPCGMQFKSYGCLETYKKFIIIGHKDVDVSEDIHRFLQKSPDSEFLRLTTDIFSDTKEIWLYNNDGEPIYYYLHSNSVTPELIQLSRLPINVDITVS